MQGMCTNCAKIRDSFRLVLAKRIVVGVTKFSDVSQNRLHISTPCQRMSSSISVEEDATATLQRCYERVVTDMKMMRDIEMFVANVKRPEDRRLDRTISKRILERAADVAENCKRCRHTHDARKSHQTLDDEKMLRASRFASMFDLSPYDHYLDHVPATVNTVSRVVAEPVPGSGTTFPLDLNQVVARCPGTYFWPVRFCPVQLAFHAVPRTRILLFHTGKIVGIGSRGTTSARLAIMLAIEKLAREANIHLRVIEFTVSNLVGMVHLGATVNNEGLSRTYKRNTNYNPSLFVGLPWKPYHYGICCEVYATGKMNLAGALTYSQMLRQFSKIHPAFLRFSSLGRQPPAEEEGNASDGWALEERLELVEDVGEQGAASAIQSRNAAFVDDDPLFDGWGKDPAASVYV